jgi:hypothetical protein
MNVRKYGRFWAVYEAEKLICLCVYKRGALEVIRRVGVPLVKPVTRFRSSQGLPHEPPIFPRSRPPARRPAGQR